MAADKYYWFDNKEKMLESIDKLKREGLHVVFEDNHYIGLCTDGVRIHFLPVEEKQ